MSALGVAQPAFAKGGPKGSLDDADFQACLGKCIYFCTKPKVLALKACEFGGWGMCVSVKYCGRGAFVAVLGVLNLSSTFCMCA